MQKPFLVSAALLALTLGATEFSFAADEPVRKIIVQPVGAKPPPLTIVKAPGGVSSKPGEKKPVILVPPDAIPADQVADNTETQVLPIVIPPQGTASPQPPDIGSDQPDLAGGETTPPEATPENPIPATEPQPADIAEVPAEPAPQAAEPHSPDDAIRSPGDLYALLADRGYDVEIVNRYADGDLIFLVTKPYGKSAYLLRVDGTYGDVLERRQVAYAYPQPKTYVRHHAPARQYVRQYSPVYAADDCAY